MLVDYGKTTATSTNDGYWTTIYLQHFGGGWPVEVGKEPTQWAVGYVKVFAPNVYFGTSDAATCHIYNAAIVYLMELGIIYKDAHSNNYFLSAK